MLLNISCCIFQPFPMPDIIHLKATGGSSRTLNGKVGRNCHHKLMFFSTYYTIKCRVVLNKIRFSSLVPDDNVKKSKKEKSKTAPSSLFQRQHVDLLLEELIKKFPPQRVKVQIKQKPEQESVEYVSCLLCSSINTFLLFCS